MYIIVDKGSHAILEECTSREWLKIADKFIAQRVSAQQAHEWVKRGGTHTTPLYVDDTGRVRRASSGC